MSYLHFDGEKANNSQNEVKIKSVGHFSSLSSIFHCLALIMIHIVVTAYVYPSFFSLLKSSLDSSSPHHLECIRQI